MVERKKLSEKSARILGLTATGRSYDQIIDGEKGVSRPDIAEAAREALAVLGASDYHARLAQIRQQAPEAYSEWTEEDDLALARMHREGANASEIADRLGRTTGAVRSRLSKFKLR